MEKHGHSYVPRTGEYSKLRGFVETQRTQWTKYKRGQPSTLREERIRDLNNMGFDWERPPPTIDPALRNLPSGDDSLKDRTPKAERKLKSKKKDDNTMSNRVINSQLSREEFWEWKYKKLQEFHAAHGHVKVNKRDLPTEARKYIIKHELIPWVAQQRLQEEFMRDGKEGDQCTMTPERKERLEQLGIIWKMPPEIKRKSGGGNKRKRPTSETEASAQAKNKKTIIEIVQSSANIAVLETPEQKECKSISETPPKTAAQETTEHNECGSEEKQVATSIATDIQIIDKPLLESLSPIAKEPDVADEVLQAIIL